MYGVVLVVFRFIFSSVIMAGSNGRKKLGSVQCDLCGSSVSLNNIARHKKRKHGVEVCV